MCDFLPRIQAANVIVTYSHSATDGLGYAGRPGGPVATITIELQNLPFQLFFLGPLMRFSGYTSFADSIMMPPMRSTITSEDLASTCTP